MISLRKIKVNYLYAPLLVLGVYLLYRFIDQSKIVKIFPLDYNNDISSYLAQLFFLKVCGFLKLCPYWYNGIITFESYSPGWYFFSFPLYLITNDVLMTAFISLVLMYVLGFFLIYVLGKHLGLTRLQRVAFFVFFFGNAIAIGNFIRLGRLTSLYGWISFLAVAVLVYWYKDKALNKYFLLFYIPAYTNLILSHPQELILAHFLILGFFIIKNNKEKIIIVSSSLAGIFLSSFWLFPFITTALRNTIEAGIWREIYKQPFNVVVSFILPLLLLGLFYFYIKIMRSKRELFFYLPVLILDFLFLMRLIPLTIILRDITLDHYLLFFLFFSLILFFKIDWDKYTLLKKIIPISLIMISLASVGFNFYLTPKFSDHGPLEKELISLSESIEGKVLIFGALPTSYPLAHYSYLAIYHNVSTASGWAETYASPDYIKQLLLVYRSFERENNCKEFLQMLKKVNVQSAIAFYSDCEKLMGCNLKLLKETDHTCLYKDET